MKLVDANLLLYAYDEKSRFHAAARAWLEEALSTPEPIRFAAVTLLAFVRIATHPRAFDAPLTLEQAFEIVLSWLVRPNVAVLDPAGGHFEDLARLAVPAQARGPLIMDAHLAMLAIEHGATLCTTDRDFTRFVGVRVLNPLEAGAPRR